VRIAGIDIGSTNVKACLFELTDQKAPVLRETICLRCPLIRSGSGRVTHDLKALESILKQMLDSLPAGIPIGFSSAMHSLVLLDGREEALDDALSWADTRSELQADWLKKREPQAHSRTGTPVHAMGWPAKLLWTKENEPDIWRNTRRVLDLKTYLLRRLTGVDVPLDRSNASATGLFYLSQNAWDASLCRRLHLEPEWLPPVQCSLTTFEHQGRRFTLGAGDGPLGNLGVGAVTPERIAISLGTSGAIRKVLSEDRAVHADELFLYSLAAQILVQGGAISNGSSVLDWLKQFGGNSPSELLSLAENTPAGAEGLTVLPYFSGERAPFWRSNVRSQIHGWSHQHELRHLTRATLEGVAYCLKRLLLILGRPTEPLRCTGGLFRNRFWCRLLADITGCCIALSPNTEATALGAALLTLDKPLEVASELPIGELVEPEAKALEEYSERYAQWQAFSS
jgi:gluconokinase